MIDGSRVQNILDLPFESEEVVLSQVDVFDVQLDGFLDDEFEVVFDFALPLLGIQELIEVTVGVDRPETHRSVLSVLLSEYAGEREATAVDGHVEVLGLFICNREVDLDLNGFLVFLPVTSWLAQKFDVFSRLLRLCGIRILDAYFAEILLLLSLVLLFLDSFAPR